MVCFVFIHYYTNDLGAGRSSYILQCDGFTKIVGRSTRRCYMEDGDILRMFGSGFAGLCTVYWRYQAP